jgi:cytochrome c-type biogenesis protein CcmH/NrfF
MCGSPGCGKKILAECVCAEAAATREELKGLVAEGLTRDEVLRFYIDKHGSQEALAMPLDEGFNRLAWLFPYLLATAAAVALGGALVRWTRHGREPQLTTGNAQADAEFEARLDDELRNLD